MSESSETKTVFSDRLQKLVTSLTNCKIEYVKQKDECKSLREANTKLVLEQKELHETVKSQRSHLFNSREMIGNLQETVSQLVYLKRDIKKIKEELSVKDSAISSLEQEKDQINAKHKESISTTKSSYAKEIEDINAAHQSKIQRMQHETETQIAQFSCVIEELKAKIMEMEAEHRDKLNLIVLEYEEKLQRSSAQITQLQDQHAGLIARTDSNIDAYRRRLEEIEEKLKQSQFKSYLAQSMPYESQVERPYSVNREYNDPEDIDRDMAKKTMTQSKNTKVNPLQITYYGNKPSTSAPRQDKKGPFSIVKKRKLYNEKDFQDF